MAVLIMSNFLLNIVVNNEVGLKMYNIVNHCVLY